MSNYLLALLLAIFLASASGAAYFISHPEQRPAVEAFINNNISAPTVEVPPVNFSGVARAPEIDASSGTNAMAILVGFLLLASEKYRANRR